MSDLLNTAAGTLTPAATGTQVDISFTPKPGIRNNWNPQPVQLSGTLDAVRVYGHGTVRVVVNGQVHFLPGSAPVKVSPHLRVPETAASASSAADARKETFTAAEVRESVIGKRLGVGELGEKHVGRMVEFEFRGVRFYGVLTSVKEALGLFSVTLDGSERFLFDDEQTLIVRMPVTTADRAAPAPNAARPEKPGAPAVPAAPVMVEPRAVSAPVDEPAVTVGTAPSGTAAAWVPVPADELEFV